GNRPNITFSPHGTPVARISEIHIDKQPVRDAPHASLENVSDVELLSDLAHVTLRPIPIAHDRRAANDLEVLDLDQAGKDIVLHAIREESVPLVFAAVFEWQNGDARLRDIWRRRVVGHGSVVPPRE